MSELLEKAFEEARRLSPDQQECFGRWLLDELDSEQRWTDAFARSQRRLEHLADEAIDEHLNARVRPPDASQRERLSD